MLKLITQSEAVILVSAHPNFGSLQKVTVLTPDILLVFFSFIVTDTPPLHYKHIQANKKLFCGFITSFFEIPKFWKKRTEETGKSLWKLN